ncbi:MAG: InlB B-repeat-containing protein [Lachnospiraceae bacterium]|nr:InlB B-repeat-containing protein [Lachnospiraceae bacterium]
MKTKQKRRNFGIVMPVIVTMLLMAVGSAVIRPAVAEAEQKPVYTDDTNWSTSNATSAAEIIEGDGTNTFSNDGTVILTLTGNTTINLDKDLQLAQITGTADLTITGSGTLTVGGVETYRGDNALNVKALTIQGGTVKATGKENGILSTGITVSGGTVEAIGGSVADKSGIFVNGELTITGGSVTATGYAGVRATTINVSGGSASATGSTENAFSANKIYASVTTPSDGLIKKITIAYSVCDKNGNGQTQATIGPMTDPGFSVSPASVTGKTNKVYDVSSPLATVTLTNTGGMPLTVEVSGLPSGLTFDNTTGKIIGTASATANTNATVTIKNDYGESVKNDSFAVEITAAPATVTDVNIKDGVTVINNNTIKLEKDNKKQLTAEILPTEATATVTWDSSNKTVATISATGEITALNEGSTTITATAGGKSANITLTVTKKIVPATKLELLADMTIAVGETVTIKPTLTPAEANGEITWSSDNTAVTVDKGTIKGTSAGSATITATITTDNNGGSASVTDKMTITVSADKPLIKDPTLPTSLTLNQKMTDIQLTATGPAAADIKWTWKYAGSSTELPPGLALSEAGVISGTPTKAGTYTVAVTATHKNQTTLSDTKEFTLVVGEGGVVFDKNGVTDSGINSAAAPNLFAVQPTGKTFLMTIKVLKGADTPTGKSETVADINKLFRGVNNSNLRMRMLDITVRNTTDNQAVSKTTNPVEIVLDVSTDYTKYTLVPFRYHNEVVTIFTKLDKRPTNTADYKDGTFYYDKNGNQIYLYTNSFSLYTLVYTTVDTYTVTFNSNGGTAVMDAIVQQGATITAPTAPTKTGFTFGGWYTDAGLTTEWDRTQPINGNMTLYASWTQAATNPGSDGDLRGANAPQTSDYMAMVYVMIALLAALAAGYAVYGISKRNEES